MTTWHEKEAYLEELRDQADSLPIAEQRQHATALSEQIKAEKIPVVRRELVRTLALFHVVESEPGLQTALEDSDPDIRIAACKAMGTRPGKVAKDALLKVIRSDEDGDGGAHKNDSGPYGAATEHRHEEEGGPTKMMNMKSKRVIYSCNHLFTRISNPCIESKIITNLIFNMLKVFF